jgi:hypothetical protein
MEMPMNPRPLTHALAGALFAVVAVSGCGKKDEPALSVEPTTPPAATTPAPAPTPPPAPAAMVTVQGVELGNTVGPDLRVAVPMTQFGKQDKIIAAVSTNTSDPVVSVPGKLGARWTFQDGQVVNEETRDVNFNGAGVTDFEVSKPDGWPAGNYKLEISLDGQVVQTREFKVD